MTPRPRLTGDDWTTEDDPAYRAAEHPHEVEVHVSGLRCRCLPFVSIVPGAQVDGSAGIAIGHGHSWPARAYRGQGHP